MILGRYLTGYVGSGDNARPKAMTTDELDAIFDAGLNVFAIYQDNIPTVEYYTKEQGRADGVSAVTAAKNLGIPEASYIYFAVDCDMMDYQVTSNAIPYFEGVREAMRDTDFLYRVGIYGSRNICTRVCNKNLAKSSFVADMSRGYSGNMGFTIPKNWAFDQFSEYVFTGAAENFDLDKDAYSGRYSGFNHVDVIGDNYEPIYTEEVFRDRAEFLLDELNIAIPSSFEFGRKETIFPYPGISIDVTVSLENELNCDNTFARVSVINGEISEASLTHVQDLYGNLDAETQNIISKDGTFSLMEGIISDIGTGEIAFRCGFNNEGNILIEYGIEEDVFNNSSVAEKLCLYISITIDKDETNSSVFEEIEVSLPSASTIAFVALSIFFILLLINFAPTLASSLLGVLANSIVLAG